MLVLNLAPTMLAAAEIKSETLHSNKSLKSDNGKSNKKVDRNLWSKYADFVSEAEVEEKIALFSLQKYPFIASQYGQAYKDQFAIPNERNYLPDEPPTA